MNRKQIIETAAQIRPFLQETPVAGYITGTGLADTLEGIEPVETIPYEDLPLFPRSTVESHTGQLVYGTSGARHILVFQGRFHLYEGYSPAQVTAPVRLLQALGVPRLILSNAAGGINLNFNPGDIMVIRDHINLTGQNPLIGPNEESLGVRFPDMSRVYDREMRELAEQTAKETGIRLRQGVYAGLTGPSLETPSETRYLKIIGADAVGFSTVMEAIAGVHAGLKLLGLSLITNINDPDAPMETTLEDVIETATQAGPGLGQLVGEMIQQMDTAP